MIKAVLFDLDGTLIDSESYYVNGTIEWLSELGITIDFNTASKIIGITMDETYSYLSKVTGINIDVIKKANSEYFNKKHPIVFKELLFKDVIECFEKLKSLNLKIGICSMSSKGYINKFIKECDLSHYVNYVFSGDDCIHQKPDPEIYNKAIKSLGFDNKEILVVEDAPSGIKAGMDSGAFVAARINTKFGLNYSDVLYTLEDLSELNTIIIEINNEKYD